MTRIAALFLLLVAWALPLNALATCRVTMTAGSQQIPMQFYYIPGFIASDINANAADGTILFSRTVSLVTSPGSFVCSNRGYQYHRGTTGTPLNGSTVPSIYPSGIAGIGMKISYIIPAVSFPYISFIPANTISTFNTDVQMNIQFIKTGPITAGGSITGEIAGWFAEDDTFQVVSMIISGGIIIKPGIPTCTVTTPGISVPMGSVSASSFNGIGTLAGTAQNFNIELSCSGGDVGTTTKMYITLTDQTNPANTTDVLSLTPSSTASGVGVQIFNGTTVVSYGPDSPAAGNINQWFVTETGNATVNIPLSARYVQTSSLISSGSAEAVATFTMSYQ